MTTQTSDNAAHALWERLGITTNVAPLSENNRYGIDYRRAADRLGQPVLPIVDIHAHIHGAQACRLYDEARRHFGVRLTYTMSQIDDAPLVRDALGPSIRFIAFPNFRDADKTRTHRDGLLDIIKRSHRDLGARMLKIWSSPKLHELVPDGATDVWEIDAPWRVRACELAQSLNMMFMVHIADPDTWYAAKYADAKLYGTKREPYHALERMLDRFPAPWIAAHMGGWPEDLPFLDGLLSRHPNLHLDTSATRWVVRELSRHPREETIAFFTKWRGRLAFGSDIVTLDDHLSPSKKTESVKSDQASSPDSAFDLYASRYFTLRLVLEQTFEAPSPIADPDLAMTDPTRYNALSGPTLRGLGFAESQQGRDLLRTLYGGPGSVAEKVDAWYTRP